MTSARSDFPSSTVPGSRAPQTPTVPSASVPYSAGLRTPPRTSLRTPTRQSAQVTRIADYRNGPTRPVGSAAPLELARAAASRRPELSPREVEVLLAWLRSESKEEAAEELFIAASTVSTHLARIRAKYVAVGRPAPTKTHLLARALQDGITGLDDW